MKNIFSCALLVYVIYPREAPASKLTSDLNYNMWATLLPNKKVYVDVYDLILLNSPTYDDHYWVCICARLIQKSVLYLYINKTKSSPAWQVLLQPHAWVMD